MKNIKSWIIIIFILCVWQIFAIIKCVPKFLLPSPYSIFNECRQMLYSGELIFHIIVSLKRVLIGFIISFVFGFTLATLNSIFEGINIYYIKLLEFLRHIPPISLIPLLILWFGIGELSKIIVIVLTAFSPIFVNTFDGIENCDKRLLEVGNMYKMSRLEKLYKIKIPYAMPQIVSGMKIGLGYSFRAIVGAEMIAAASGIGYLIINSQTLIRIDKVMVGVIVIGIIGLVIDFVFDKLSIIFFKKFYYK